jgi:hypothetical protein
MSGRLAAKSILAIETKAMQVGPDQHFAVHSFHVVNSSTSRRKVRVHHCSQGEIGSATNALLYDVPVLGTSTIIHDARFMMVPGDELRVSSDGTGLSIVVHGLVAG